LVGGQGEKNRKLAGCTTLGGKDFIELEEKKEEGVCCKAPKKDHGRHIHSTEGRPAPEKHERRLADASVHVGNRKKKTVLIELANGITRTPA